MKAPSRKVEPSSTRPFSEERCYTCHEKMGEDHKPDCVCLRRTVVVRLTVEYVVSTPQSWEPHDVVFQRNQGSWCGTNAIEELQNLSGESGCLCAFTEYALVREATEEDEKKCAWDWKGDR